MRQAIIHKYDLREVWRILIWLQALVIASIAVLSAQSIPSGPGLMQTGGPTITATCGGVSLTNLANCYLLEEGSGDVIGDEVGGDPCQLGSTSGSDANDAAWVSTGLDFDDSNDYVVCPSLLNPTANFTVTAVWQAVTATGTQVYVSQQDGGGTGRSIVAQAAGTEVAQSSLGGSVTATSALSNGVWYAVTVRHNSGTVSVTVNANSPASASRTVESAAGAWIFGMNKNLSTEPAAGNLAMVVVWDAALSDATINSNFTAIGNYLAGRSISF